MLIEEGDRRFVVAPQQEKKLEITEDEVLQIESELLGFASYLNSFDVNATIACTAIETPAKEEMRRASMNTAEEFAAAVRGGTLAYFVQAYTDSSEVSLDRERFKEILFRWLQAWKIGRDCFVPNAELVSVYNHLSGNDLTAVKWGKLMQHKNLPRAKMNRIDGRAAHGRQVRWQVDPQNAAVAEELLQSAAAASSGTFNRIAREVRLSS